jgi:predicted nucleic acid-binding protein
MRLAFDTSVLVAALVEPHPFHQRALPWIEALETGKAAGTCTCHALAETWSVLTRLPLEPSISPPMATVAMERLAQKLEVIDIGVDLYWNAIQRCTATGVRSGALFDALHLVVAEATDADFFVTFNAADFRRLAVDASPEIRVPPDPPLYPF